MVCNEKKNHVLQFLVPHVDTLYVSVGPKFVRHAFFSLQNIQYRNLWSLIFKNINKNIKILNQAYQQQKKFLISAVKDYLCWRIFYDKTHNGAVFTDADPKKCLGVRALDLKFQ